MSKPQTTHPSAIDHKISAVIDRALQAIVNTPDGDPLPLLTTLLNSLRPRHRHNGTDALQRWHYMNQQLASTPALQLALREMLLRLFNTHEQVTFYADSGLLPNSGFFSELSRKLMHKVLPEPRDTHEPRACVSVIFSRSDDEEWIAAIPLDERRRFWELIALRSTDDIKSLRNIMEQMLEATLVLSHRISAMGLEPELARVYPHLRAAESPFIAMNIEIIKVVDSLRDNLAGACGADDGSQLFVLIAQCVEVVQRARLASARLGTSMRLSFLLTRLTQHLERLRLLLEVLTARLHPDVPHELTQSWTDFLHDALSGERQYNSIRKHFENLASLLALRVTDNAARTGEHYIAGNRHEWFTMLRQAGGGGFFIALLALLKILGYKIGLGPTAQGWLNGFLYANGFALIYMLHLLVATKQPAMTAATLASSISNTRGGAAAVMGTYLLNNAGAGCHVGSDVGYSPYRDIVGESWLRVAGVAF